VVEIVFLMLILKLPIVYVCGVVWYAIKAEPKPPEGAIVPAELRPGPLPHQTSSRLRRLRGGRPHGRPTRRPFGPPRTASARAGRRR
jgi:predicted membrane channel-forming protein YqfA (hemolysin III family)